MIQGELAIVKKDIRKLQREHRANPHRHSFQPIRVVMFDPSKEKMMVGCGCGAYLWIAAREVKN